MAGCDGVIQLPPGWQLRMHAYIRGNTTYRVLHLSTGVPFSVGIKCEQFNLYLTKYISFGDDVRFGVVWEAVMGQDRLATAQRASRRGRCLLRLT